MGIKTIYMLYLLLRDKVRTMMKAFGFSEIITYSFVSPDSVNALVGETPGALNAFTRIMNPLTVDQSVLRTSLIPGVMETARYNVLHEMGDLKLFEWGKVFFDREDELQPLEKICLAGIMVGVHTEESWYNEERPVDFYDVKGTLAVLLKELGLDGFRFKQEKWILSRKKGAIYLSPYVFLISTKGKGSINRKRPFPLRSLFDQIGEPLMGRR